MLYYTIFYYRIADMYTYAFKDATKAVQNKSPQGDFHHAFLQITDLTGSKMPALEKKTSSSKDVEF